MNKEIKIPSLTKENWNASFMLIGTPKITDYTYKMDEKSEKSAWVYSALNLGVDCGEKHGVVYAEMMGGYNSEEPGVIYAHGKKQDGSDDFSAQIQVDWEDRFNEEILADIGDLSFITVGLEKTDKNKTFYKKFLSAYDAVGYIKDNLTEDMIVNVKGNLKYSKYNGNTQVRKVITSVTLSKVDDVSKYVAKFTQTILLTKDSFGEADKTKGVIPIHAKVLDYMKEYNGVEIKGQVPFDKMFDYEIDLSNKELVKQVYTKVFKVKKGVTQITFEGDLIEGGAVVMATEDDIPDDIKELIEIGVYSKEEALAKCSENGNREQRMVLRKPVIKMVGEEGAKTPIIQKFEEKYTEDDLIFYVHAEETDAEDSEDVVDNENIESETVDDSMDWLNNL